MTDGQLSTSRVSGSTGVCNTFTADEQTVDSVIIVHEVIVIRSTNLCNNHCNSPVTGSMHNCA